MKVLIANWSWYPTGGDWTYIENVKRLYEQNGHEVIVLSTDSSLNVEEDSVKYFIPRNDFKVLNKSRTIGNKIKVLKKSIVSKEALDAIDAILARHEVHLAHLHNIHHYITPAIIWKLKKAGVKIIWTLHDYKIICPENSFVSNEKICEQCMTGNFYNCTLNKCKKNSYAASFLASIDAYFYHSSKVYDKVDYFLCPSAFLMQKFRQFGFDESKLILTNYCYDINIIDTFITDFDNQLSISKTAHQSDDYILFIGRIEKIKGIKTLLDAIKETKIKLKIVGTGSEIDALIDYANKQGIYNAEFLRFQDKNSVFILTYRSKFVVCPSEWYENFPYSVTESFLLSKPVVGANIGGIPELVKDGKTGLLFEQGNAADLQMKLLKLWNNQGLIDEMGKNARKLAYDIFNFKTHWNILQTVFTNLKLNDN